MATKTNKLETMKVVYQTLSTGKHLFYIVKKNGKYLTIRNNELALSTKQSDAILFDTEGEIKNFINNATIDTRNARVIGKSYHIVDVTLIKK